jgi:hypothetical protein
MIKTVFLSTLVSAACVTTTAAAQSGATGAQQRGKLEPSGLVERRVHLDKFATISAAERAYAVARLDEIERIILKAVPEFGHLKYPIFADVQGFFAVPPKPTNILQYSYGLFADLGPRGYCDLVTVTINKTMYGTPSEAIVEEPLGKPVPGANATWSELVQPPDPSYETLRFVRNGEAPYLQLTREEFRRSQIVQEEGANGEKLAKTKKLLASTPYERFMAEAPERQKLRDETAAALKAFKTPAEIEALIKEMKDVERSAATELKAQEADARKQNDSLSRTPSIAENARTSIARMSAAERKLPAFVVLGAGVVSDTLYTFGTAESPDVARVMRGNPAFWTMHRSRVEVRSLDLAFRAACPKEPPPPDVHAALWKLRQTIDWGALKRMVNEP